MRSINFLSAWRAEMGALCSYRTVCFMMCCCRLRGRKHGEHERIPFPSPFLNFVPYWQKTWSLSPFTAGSKSPLSRVLLQLCKFPRVHGKTLLAEALVKLKGMTDGKSSASSVYNTTSHHRHREKEREWAAPDTNNLKPPLALAYAAEFLTIAR